MGDPAYLDDLATFEDEMLSPAYAAEIRRRIDDARTQNVSAYNPDGFESTLEAIAGQGSEVFYSGDIAKATITSLRSRNGTMTLEDLMDYNTVRREPVMVSYGDYDITSCGAPASGAVALSIIKVAEGYAGRPRLMQT